MINIDDRLRVLKKSFSQRKNFKQIKGCFGEDLAAELLINKWNLNFISRNQRTPYGEIDLFFKTNSGDYLLIEVKLDLVGREGCFIWSPQQKLRLLKSRSYLIKRLQVLKIQGFKVETGLCLIRPKTFSFFSEGDGFF